MKKTFHSYFRTIFTALLIPAVLLSLVVSMFRAIDTRRAVGERGKQNIARELVAVKAKAEHTLTMFSLFAQSNGPFTALQDGDLTMFSKSVESLQLQRGGIEVIVLLDAHKLIRAIVPTIVPQDVLTLIKEVVPYAENPLSFVRDDLVLLSHRVHSSDGALMGHVGAIVNTHQFAPTLPFERLTDFQVSLSSAVDEVIDPHASLCGTDTVRYFGHTYAIGLCGAPPSMVALWIGGKGFIVTFALIMLISVAIAYFVSRKIARNLQVPITQLSNVSTLFTSSNVEKYRSAFATVIARNDEFSALAQVMDDAQERLRRMEQERASLAAQALIGRTMAQVAHDIRSPLSSMQVAMRGLKIMQCANEQMWEYLNLLNMSAVRIGAIADDLLNEHRDDEERPVIFSLHAVLDELIGEYQQREDTQGIAFVKQYHDRAIELYGPRTRLQRAVGNIVKNAIEAVNGVGVITAVTSQSNGYGVLAISDTGSGMSQEMLAKVLRGGHTEGKWDGHGIGTTVVRETVNAFAGQLEGKSVVGEGTTFRLVLPLPAAEQCEKSEREVMALRELRIAIRAGEPVIVVDDEPSMREQWRVLLAEQHTAVRFCSCYEDVEAQDITAAVSHTAIVDYHFANSDRNGIEVIQLLRERGISVLILCTAEYWKPSVQQQAKSLGIALCPKPVPTQIVVDRWEATAAPKEQMTSSASSDSRGRHEETEAPITTSPAVRPNESLPETASLSSAGPPSSPIPCDCVLIDDDLLIHQMWQMAGRNACKTVQAFAKAEAFFAVAAQIDKHTPIYVDANLGNGVKGQDVAKQIHEQGFDTIYLATGYNADHFGNLPWVKGIIGKEPPWSGAV